MREWTEARGGFGHQTALADVLFLEHEGAWKGAAEAAQRARGFFPNYISLAVHEALGWLGAREPQNAQAALDGFPIPWRREARGGDMWLASLVALHEGKLPDASQFLAIYLDADAPTTEAGIRAALLREWDHRVATIGEPNPALNFPNLPPAVTGLATNACRPQYGPPVLPQHQSGPDQRVANQDDRLHVLAVATEWYSGHGGLSTFNRQLCRALAAAGAGVVCIVLDMPYGVRREVDGVTLVGATRTPGRSEHEAITRKPRLPDGFSRLDPRARARDRPGGASPRRGPLRKPTGV